MRTCPHAPADLLPHAAPMILIDEALLQDETSFVAAITIRHESLFLEEFGVPSYVGLEYMAQTCGAFAGAMAKASGQPIQIGFLLGSRDYTADRGHFRIGERLLVRVRLVFDEGEMSVFAGDITIEGVEVARAQLNLYRPRDPASFLGRPQG